MTIDPITETLVKLAEVPRLTWMPRPRRKRLHTSTIFRWTKRGLRGVVLETIRIGGTLYTSEEALLRFFDRQSSSETAGEALPSQIPRTRRGAIKAAERRLDSVGI